MENKPKFKQVLSIFILIILVIGLVYSIKKDTPNIPRVMFWSGKVNQHWNLSMKTWQTDPDGSSGADINKLTYCQKFYPSTIKVVIYQNETTDTWKDAGNIGYYNSTKMSYRCVLKDENVDGEDVSNLLEKSPVPDSTYDNRID